MIGHREEPLAASEFVRAVADLVEAYRRYIEFKDKDPSDGREELFHATFKNAYRELNRMDCKEAGRTVWEPHRYDLRKMIGMTGARGSTAIATGRLENSFELHQLLFYHQTCPRLEKKTVMTA